MQTRAMGPGAGWRWLVQGVNLGRNNPRAVFGGAILLLLSVMALAFGLSAIVTALTAALKPGMVGTIVLSLVLMLPIFLALAGLMVGYLRVIDAVESGREARATGVFAGFRDLPVAARAIAFTLSLAMAQNALIFVLIALLAPEFGSWYLATLQTSMGAVQQTPDASLPQGFGMAFALLVIVSLFGYAVQAIGLGQIALRGRGVGGALLDGVAGAAKNLMPLLVLALSMLGVMILIIVLAALVAMMIGALVKVAGIWIGVVLGVPLYVAAVVAGYVIMFGVMYHLWRDVTGAGAAPPAANQNGIVAA